MSSHLKDSKCQRIQPTHDMVPHLRSQNLNLQMGFLLHKKLKSFGPHFGAKDFFFYTRKSLTWWTGSFGKQVEQKL